MSTKTKKTSTNIEKLAQATQQLGVVLMTAAVTLGMLEMPEHPNNRVVVPNQPALALASADGEDNAMNNPLRREREEAGPHYISYSTAQRTPSRMGKQ